MRRWNDAEPVPPPRPEIEAGLAESLQRVLHEAPEDSEPAKAQKTSKRFLTLPTTPPADSEANLESQSYSPEQDNGEMDPKKRKRTFSNRTKTGCHTCRKRKKKCDEGKPHCANCTRGGYACEGYGPKPPLDNQKSAAKTPLALQSKATYEPSQGPTTFFQSSTDGPRYDPWARGSIMIHNAEHLLSWMRCLLCKGRLSLDPFHGSRASRNPAIWLTVCPQLMSMRCLQYTLSRPPISHRQAYLGRMSQQHWPTFDRPQLMAVF